MSLRKDVSEQRFYVVFLFKVVLVIILVVSGTPRFCSIVVVVAMTLTSFGSSNDILGFFDKLGNLEYDFLALLNSILAKTDVILVELDLIGMF